MSASDPLTEAEIRWLLEAEGAVNVNAISAEIARELYPDILEYGPCFPALKAFLQSFARKTTQSQHDDDGAWKITQIRRILRFAKKHGLADVSDEIHRSVLKSLQAQGAGESLSNTSFRRTRLYPVFSGTINGYLRYNFITSGEKHGADGVLALDVLGTMMWMSSGEKIFDDGSSLEKHRQRLALDVEGFLRSIAPEWEPWKPRALAALA